MRNQTIAALLVGLLVLVGCHQQGASGQHQPKVVLKAEPAPQGLPTLAPMLARVSPAVVNVSVRKVLQAAPNPLLDDPLFRRFFKIPPNFGREGLRAVGSGIIIDATHGYVITNDHLVKDAQRIEVTLKDGRALKAEAVGSDPKTDIALLHVDADNLAALPLGSSSDLRVGDYVVAIGDPFGVGQTATFGIVSGLGRTGLGIESYEDFIQTDASINPGNSGGALVNVAGQLVGMTTAILSKSGGNIGVGFAIPSDMLRTIANKLIAYGKVARGELGVTIQNLTPVLARAMQANVSAGALVTRVNPDSPAAKAGIRPGDVVTRLDGKQIDNSSDLRNRVGEKEPGTSIQLTILRDGKEHDVSATLTPLEATVTSASGPSPSKSSSLAGVSLGPVPQSDPSYGTVHGVYVEDVDPASAAASSGLQQGDIITGANGIAIRTVSELDEALHRSTKGRPLLLEVQRGGTRLFLGIE